MGNIAIRTFFLCSLLGLQGCDLLWNLFEPKFNIKKEDYAPGVVDGDQEPPYSTPKMSKSSLLGIDADNDGVRDDIEIWINRNIDDVLIRKFLKTYTKRHNYFLTCDSEKECLNAYRLHRRTSQCWYLVRSEEWKTERILKIEEVIDAFFFNSGARKNARAKMSNYLAATSWGSADFLGMYLLRKDFCDFDLELNENELKDIWSYSSRSGFVWNIKRGNYEKNFGLSVNTGDYPGLCEGFSGPEKNLCD